MVPGQRICPPPCGKRAPCPAKTKPCGKRICPRIGPASRPPGGGSRLKSCSFTKLRWLCCARTCGAAYPFRWTAPQADAFWTHLPFSPHARADARAARNRLRSRRKTRHGAPGAGRCGLRQNRRGLWRDVAGGRPRLAMRHDGAHGKSLPASTMRARRRCSRRWASAADCCWAAWGKRRTAKRTPPCARARGKSPLARTLCFRPAWNSPAWA